MSSGIGAASGPTFKSASGAQSAAGSITPGLRIERGSYARFTSWNSVITRSEEHTSELQSRPHLVCRLLLEKKKKSINANHKAHTISEAKGYGCIFRYRFQKDK